MESEYSKREIDLIVEGIKTHIDEKDSVQDEKLDKILIQTTKTNGRVSNLENWRSYLVGAWAVISLIVIPTLTFIYFQDKYSLEEQVVENQQEIKKLLRQQ